jgi:hypothetical protein
VPANHGDQKRREKKKRKAEAARRERRERPSSLGISEAAIVREAAALPPGPTFISADYAVLEEPPRLVTILFTRTSPVRIVVPTIVLVDRTCLGVKNAFIAKPLREREVSLLVQELGRAHDGGMTSCELLVAQSIVFHALDYAATLGFAPHRDFPELLVGPRPDVLLDTPFARRERPFYTPGPDDAREAVIAQLDARVGSGNYQLFASG